ncbi:MAG: hypothetical protein CMA48_03790, partial [Euryarchaeota archaeon]|nr:hypothetical protein [Euryarchaeota archaeon]
LESGAKAKTIKKYLGKGWIVDACNGHVQDLPVNNKAMWAYKEGELPNPPWSWTDEKAERKLSTIMNKASKSSVNEIFIATDPDREGEFIAWRLKEILSDFDSIQRISFNEITKDAVMSAISEPRDVDMDLVNAAIVRRLIDRLVGWRCSKFCKSWKLKSMGRVQTPTLGFIVEKELERDNHVPKKYHSVSVPSNGIEMNVRFHESDDPDAWLDDEGKHHPNRTSNTELAEQTVEQINSTKKLILIDSKEGTVNRKPKPPFTTDTMLQTANSTLGWSISKTSGVASSLYNGGHITYIRTDSTRTNLKARESVRDHISSKLGEKYLGQGVGESGKRTSNVQDAHEAIRPSDPTIESAGKDIDEKKLYQLIWSRFAASQMSNSVRERRTLKFSCDGVEVPITGTASWRTHDGWENVFSWSIGEVQTTPPKIGFSTGESWNIDSEAEITVDFTKPPRRFTESSIIQEMKKSGIGRPSTYVSMVKNLELKRYIEKDGSSLMPTKNGRTLWLDVAPHYNQPDGELFSADFTAIMEADLDSIEDGLVDAHSKWTEFEQLFRKIHLLALEKRKQKPTLKQMEYLQRILANMSEGEVSEILGSKTLMQLSGDDVKNILDDISEEKKTNIAPSEKQIALIIRVSDRLGLELDVILREMGLTDLSELSGGKDGSASELIDRLLNMDRNSPATERQVAAIISMVEKLEMPIEQALEAVRTESIETITKSDASILIGNLKKTINSKRRSKK